VAEAILADLDFGTMNSNAEPLAYWTKVFQRAIMEEKSSRTALGHGSNNSSGGGWGHGEDYFSGEDLVALLDVIATLYQPEPYTFTAGDELGEAYHILKTRPKTDEGDLYRELLVTELNFVAGLGLVDEADRVAVLISWGESLLVAPPAAKALEKGLRSPLYDAFQVFQAINTAGGGGVDE